MGLAFISDPYRCAKLNKVEQLFGMRIMHADTAVRDQLPDQPGPVGAMNAIRVKVEPHPPGSQHPARMGNFCCNREITERCWRGWLAQRHRIGAYSRIGVKQSQRTAGFNYQNPGLLENRPARLPLLLRFLDIPLLSKHMNNHTNTSFFPFLTYA